MSAPRLAPLYVVGAAFYAPDYATIEDAILDRKRSPSALPEFPFVTGRLRRFTSLVTQLHLEVSGSALVEAALPPSSVMPIFGSAYGELVTGMAIEETIFSEKRASAAQFTQSVHNTPSGIFSMAAENKNAAVALAAGIDTLGLALIEASLVATETGSPILVSIADEPPPPLLRSDDHAPAFAAAWVLLPEKTPGAFATLTLARTVKAENAPDFATFLPAHLRLSAGGPAALLMTLSAGGSVPLGQVGGALLSVDVQRRV